MIPATMANPISEYNPVSIFTLKPLQEVTELKLLVQKRYCDLDFSSGIAYFYLELSDGSSSFILPCKYFEWLAASEAKYVYCKYQKIASGKNFLNVLEIARIPDTYIKIQENSKEKVNPLANNNLTIQKDYVLLHKEMVDMTRVLHKNSDILYTGMATANLKNGLYVKAHSSVKNLFAFGRVGIQYRYLNINQKIITDLEVFSSEI